MTDAFTPELVPADRQRSPLPQGGFVEMLKAIGEAVPAVAGPTMRLSIAAQILAGLLPGLRDWEECKREGHRRSLARLALSFADALMLEHEQPKT